MKSVIFWTNPFKRDSNESDADFIRRVPLFNSLNQRQAEKLLQIIHIREYSEGEIVFREGDPGVGMYIIRSGEIELHRERSGSSGRFAVLGPGDFFGDIALLNESPRSASAVCSRKTTLYGLFRHDLISLLESDPRLGLKIIYPLAKITAERLRLTLADISVEG
jgi:CRP-like cAMP-binding protein